MPATDVTKLIERLKAFEDRMSVRLEALSAHLDPISDDIFLIVRGELHPQAGANLRQDVELVIAAYDTSSKIVGTGSCRFQAESFFGFDIFEAFIKIDVNDVKRIRVFPKQAI